jgi:hypothetical protein
MVARNMRRIAVAALAMAAGTASAAQLTKPALAAYDAYRRQAEARIDAQSRNGPFLWVDASPERLRAVRDGQIVTRPWNEKGQVKIPDGLVHDWIGAVFVPGVTIDRLLASVQDYDRDKVTHKPEVIDSKLLSRNGNDFKIYLRLFKKKVISVVLDTYHEARFTEISPTRWQSRSYSTKIAEVKNPGEPDERELPPGNDHGFLWRLDSYWRFEQRDGGVYVECEALSLTRDVPAGLGWLIEPIIRDLPRESLAGTLRATRDAAR